MKVEFLFAVFGYLNYKTTFLVFKCEETSKDQILFPLTFWSFCIISAVETLVGPPN